jgi:hypothetical protein
LAVIKFSMETGIKSVMPSAAKHLRAGVGPSISDDADHTDVRAPLLESYADEERAVVSEADGESSGLHRSLTFVDGIRSEDLHILAIPFFEASLKRCADHTLSAGTCMVRSLTSVDGIELCIPENPLLRLHSCFIARGARAWCKG